MLEDQRLMFLIQSREQALADMLAEQARRTAAHDQVRVEDDVVTYYQQGTAIWSPKAEMVGMFFTDLDRWRWWWVMPNAKKGGRLDAAFALAQQRGIVTITSRNPAVANEREATLLARVMASLANAQGVYEQREQDKITYYALFAGSPVVTAHLTQTPPPGTVRTMTPPPAAARRTATPPPATARLSAVPASAARIGTPPPGAVHIPPPPGMPGSRTIAPASGPSMRASVRDPSWTNEVRPLQQENVPVYVPAREHVQPVAQQAYLMVQRQVGVIHQALVVIDVDVRGGKGRFSALVVAIDSEGELTALETTPELMDAAATMIRDDARSGNGRWRRLAVRLLGKPTGGVGMDVKVRA